LAACYYLPRRGRVKAVRTRRVEPELIVDLSAKGEAPGIEITAPAVLTVAALNCVLREFGAAPVHRSDVAPLRAA